MNVRRAHLGDAAATAAVIAAVAPEGSIGAEPPVDLEERAERFRVMIADGDPAAGWVVEDDGRVVGYATVTERFRGVLTLGMALLPPARGRGAGRALLREVIAHARSCAAHKVELEAWLDNGRAIALYASCGFEVEGVRRDHYRRRDGSLRSSMIMALRLE